MNVNNIDSSTKRKMHEIQQTLLKIDNKEPVFFNIAMYVNKYGLVRRAKTHKEKDYKTNWLLTEKGKQFIKVVF